MADVPSLYQIGASKLKHAYNTDSMGEMSRKEAGKFSSLLIDASVPRRPEDMTEEESYQFMQGTMQRSHLGSQSFSPTKDME